MLPLYLHWYKVVAVGTGKLEYSYSTRSTSYNLCVLIRT